MPKLSPVSYKRLVRVFEADGFRCVREEGDHMVFTKPGVIRHVVIPKYASVPVLVIKNNLRTARMSRERHLAIARNVTRLPVSALTGRGYFLSAACQLSTTVIGTVADCSTGVAIRNRPSALTS
jgi:predicted RNA binding protein YcfA (HicA-like mRNA interferase family)